MRDIGTLIRDEVECTSVDFKRDQYASPKHNDLICDVVAMAKADVEGDRYIAIGVKLFPDGRRELRGIAPDQMVDIATYEQLLTDNVEPALAIQYVPHELDGKLFAILVIRSCDQQPYVIKKDRGSLRRGDSFIRRGTHNARLTRGDLERIYGNRSRRADLLSTLLVSLKPNRDSNRCAVPAMGTLDLPSSRARDRIQTVLAERERIRESDSPLGWRVLQSLDVASLMGGTTPYEQRDTETLKKNLERVSLTYAEHDHHYVFEQMAHRLEIHLYNGADRYIEDASLVIRVPALDGVLVADRVYDEPAPPGWMPPTIRSSALLHYPLVERADDEHVITGHIGDLRHGVWEPAFDEPPRLAIHADLMGETIPVHCEVRGRNLPQALKKQLHLTITPAAEAPHATSGPAD
jgi:hypothetical protein